MADTKTSALTAASVAALANEFAINEAGTSKKVTGTQIVVLVAANLAQSPSLLTLATSYTLAAGASMVVNRSYLINSGIKLTLGSAARFRVL